MLQFALFAGDGWDDFQGTFATLEEAVAAGQALLAEGYGQNWYHVVDLSIGSLVSEG